MKPFFAILSIIFLLGNQFVSAQTQPIPSSAKIYHQLQKLNFLGTVLYVAAHPDDENTRMISYLSNHTKARTAYISLTRGDGGQNLIGSEIREKLGVIRTQELLQARKIDGGHQFFSRANDFGFSKIPEETFEIWDREVVMSDLIHTIRKWKPDVIINRFSHESHGKTHGHHTASAILSYEAFEKAADPFSYPDQIAQFGTWQPARLFYNTSWWFYGGRDKFAKVDKSNMVAIDIGTYYPILGLSNSEIAAQSRSMHKCQGFGSALSRGTQMEYLEFLKGEPLSEHKDVFEGINTTWSRVENGKPVGTFLNQIINKFNHQNPAAIINDLIQLHGMIQKTKDKHWKKVKTEELELIIQNVLGLYLEASADKYALTQGDNAKLKVEVVNRSNQTITLKSATLLPLNTSLAENMMLKYNDKKIIESEFQVTNSIPKTEHYWLTKPGTLGMYAINDESFIGLPETPRSLKVQFKVDISGKEFIIEKDIVHKYVDPAIGELVRPLEIVNPAYATLEQDVFLFSDDNKQQVTVKLRTEKEGLSGNLSINTPKDWSISPKSHSFSNLKKGEETFYTFELSPSKESSEGNIEATINIDGKTYKQSFTSIEYNHIPAQIVSLPSVAKVVRLDLKIEGNKIGYIKGAGDKVPECLQSVGYQVEMLDLDNIGNLNLTQYDAIILGIRSFNIHEKLKFANETLFKYVENGGNVIVQYNTNRRLKTDKIAPFPIKLSRDRVTQENAEVRIISPDHSVMNYPNKITNKDFEGWVQERGLYFANEWSSDWKAILSSNDNNEPARNGGFLVAPYGKGNYIYSGYSWFRELPAGVPGAYRIFANMIAIPSR